MPSLAELGFKERVTNHDGDYRASLYTNDGHFVAWYRRCVRFKDDMEIRDSSNQMIVIPRLNLEQILGAQVWLEKHHP